MDEQLTAKSLREAVDRLATDAATYFGRARDALRDVSRPSRDDYFFGEKPERDHFWDHLPKTL